MPNGRALKVKNTVFQLRPAIVAHRFILLLSSFVPSLKPKLQTALVRTIYSTLSIFLKSDDSPFLNYGFTSLDPHSKELILEPKDESDRYSIQLYYRVAGASPLKGKTVLEVGCGRGGGASFVSRYLQPAAYTGLDLSASAVRHCRRKHRINVLKFLQGKADDLPFPNDSFDAVINVESSHCYPSFEKFLGEVARVLRRDGVFLFADLRPRAEIALMRAQLRERFAIVEEECITENVLRALELDSSRRSLLIHERAPRFLHKGLEIFAGVNGSPVFEGLASGDLQYLRFVLQRSS